MLSMFITIPLAALVLINLPFRKVARGLSLPAVAVLALAQIILTGADISNLWNISGLIPSAFFALNLGVDNLSLLLLLCNGLVVFVSAFLVRSFTQEGEGRFNFINLLLIAFAGINGIALTRDIFSLYVFLEITAVTSFIMVSFNKDKNAFEGAFKYILLSAVATVLMLSAIGLFLLISGDTSFAAIKAALANPGNSLFAILGIGLFLCGTFIKAGVVPFHGWVADAYSASGAAVSVFLAGVATKAMGVYTLMRVVVSVFGYNPRINAVLLFLGIISIIVGALAALTQNNLKRLLAYSSISQVGYIVLGLACGTPLGIAGAALHFFNHAVFKSLLFVNAAALEKQTGTIDMDDLGGLGSKMPVTSTTSVIAALSCSGVPPLAGFWSKLLIIIALWQTGNYLYAVIAILASLLTLAYMLFVQRKVFFGELKGSLDNIKEAGLEICFAAAALAVVTVGVGILFPFNLCRLIAR